VLLALLARPSERRRAQAAVVMIEHEKTGGAAVEGNLSPPGSHRSANAVLREMLHVANDRTRPLVPAELAEALRRAFARSAEAGVTVPFELGAAAPLLAKALTGDAAAFAPVAVDGGHELPVDPEDDDELEVASKELAEHLVEVREDDPVLERSGPFVVRTMCDYKWRYGDRHLGSWTSSELDEYLLDYFPRKVSADDELVADAPTCVVAFLTMLDDHGALQGAPLEALCAHLQAATEAFRRAASDRRRWGPAKSAVMGMVADGVDPEDPAAVKAWIAGQDTRADPSGPGPRRLAPTGATSPARSQPRGRAPAGARAKRKSARAARRRNRR
jgi:hypothetical protein